MSAVEPTTVELYLPDDRYPIDQSQALLTACGALVTDEHETAIRALLAAVHRPRHREHTAALVAVVDELAELMDLPAREVPWVLLAGTDTPEIVFEAVRRAPRGKWLLAPSRTWAQLMVSAITTMLVAYCDDEQDVAELVAAARMRLYSQRV